MKELLRRITDSIYQIHMESYFFAIVLFSMLHGLLGFFTPMFVLLFATGAILKYLKLQEDKESAEEKSNTK